MRSFSPYSDVNKILNYLLRAINDVLGDQFVGMYVQGSLALGDFAPNRSDIDLVVVTKSALPPSLLEKLKLMHKKISLSNKQYTKRLECIYIPINSLRHYSQKQAYFPCLHVGGEFYTDGFGIIEKHILREKGIVLKGPDPKSFIETVSQEKLKKAVLGSLRNWWLPQLTDHSRLIKDDYQVYAILTMCRTFYNLEKGDIVSKSKAVEYFKRSQNKKWVSLIDKALLWEIGNKFNRLEETRDFIKYTLSKLGCL